MTDRAASPDTSKDLPDQGSRPTPAGSPLARAARRDQDEAFAEGRPRLRGRQLLRGESLRRAVAAAAYLGLARHLPWSWRPLGGPSRRLRAALAARMLDGCGREVNIEHGAWFGTGRGVSVGDYSDIGVDALVMGPLEVGANVMMGQRCVLLAGRHDFRRTDIPMNRQGFLPEKAVVLEDDVWLGSNVVVLPGRRVGRGSIVGAGSVVTADVPPYSVVGGNPARVLASRLDPPAPQG